MFYKKKLFYKFFLKILKFLNNLEIIVLNDFNLRFTDKNITTYSTDFVFTILDFNTYFQINIFEFSFFYHIQLLLFLVMKPYLFVLRYV